MCLSAQTTHWWSPTSTTRGVCVHTHYTSWHTRRSLGRNPLINRFLCGTLRLRPAQHLKVLIWDVAVVLEGLCNAPFEKVQPTEKVPIKFLILETAFHVAISSLMRIGDLQALFMSGICTWHGQSLPPSWSISKVPTNTSERGHAEVFL